MAAITLTRSHRLLVGIVLAGAVVIATIGFVGSYAAVRDLAERKGFGEFAPFFPIGIDAGIVVMLALDLLLTWLRIPFPLLRQTAWLLTAATVAFNGAAAWGDPLAVGMHAIIPVLFIITVEAARHAIGRITDITADKHMEGVRFWRWFLAPLPTFRLWRRMKLWELRSYEQVIELERERLVYRAQLRARYGRAWRRRAPVVARLPLKLAHLGVPLGEATEMVHRPLAGETSLPVRAGEPAAVTAGMTADRLAPVPARRTHGGTDGTAGTGGADDPPPGSAPLTGTAPPETPLPSPAFHDPTPHEHDPARAGSRTAAAPEPTVGPAPEPAPAAGPRHGRRAARPVHAAEAAAPGEARVTVPVGPNRRRTLGPAVDTVESFDPGDPRGDDAPHEHGEHRAREQDHEPVPVTTVRQPPPPDPAERQPEPMTVPELPIGLPAGKSEEAAFYDFFGTYVMAQGDYPNARQFSRHLHDNHGVRNSDGGLLTEGYLRPRLADMKRRHRSEMGTGV
ncbi:DUF2637 domain-containing protein [Streptomyces sp. ST2-7A]|uniref:DUF2637 domain-containing protein n=1 Tax=Streptomyces sp. ST2-7A TaxID=2907214 RepID=UPI001F48E241|nr:DUF2637 domain-containing protein [Streptomyces sp. ST2-7A]MCE7080307.1 DUF2637 domain-containing protein [Streptomyces sp. ST2-7A]